MTAVANFEVKDRTPPRFPGDFQIVTIGGVTPTDEEAASVAKLHAALDGLAAGIADEKSALLRNGLVVARQNWRSQAAVKLKAEVDRFVAGQLDAKAFSARVAEIEAASVGSKPDIVIEDVKPARFPGEFSVICVGYAPDAAEETYLAALKGMMDYLDTEASVDQRAQDSDAVLAARVEERRKAVEALKTDAGYWREGTDSASLANNILVIRGGYKALRDRLGQSLFAVSIVKSEGEKDFAVDLKITVDRDLPAPNHEVSPEKQDLYVQIDNACAIIRTVCQQIRERANTRFRKKTNNVDVEATRRAQRLLDEYVNKLAGIGRLGLEGPHTALAKLALASLKSEFVAREAGGIKNRYVRRLGWWAGGFAALFLGGYVLIRLNACVAGPAVAAQCAMWPWVCGLLSWWTGWWSGNCAWWDAHKTFLLAAGGAAIGTWLSFAVRRLDLPFEELALQEEELLAPQYRILFVVALTLTVCLLFWTSAINIEIGSLKTGPGFFAASGSIAILIGVFCGLSERALATAISGRAAAFVRGVAGGG